MPIYGDLTPVSFTSPAYVVRSTYEGCRIDVLPDDNGRRDLFFLECTFRLCDLTALEGTNGHVEDCYFDHSILPDSWWQWGPEALRRYE